MTERPILFSSAMVRAILAGTKTQTRRIMKPQPTTELLPRDEWHIERGLAPLPEAYFSFRRPSPDRSHYALACPYGHYGDHLWVRENWWHYKSDYLEQAGFEGGTIALLESGKPSAFHANDGFDPSAHAIWRKRPSIYMPRWASRITLEITEVRVQRLQEIDELDALAEGVEGQRVDGVLNGERGEYIVGSARDAFAKPWDGINGERRVRVPTQLGDHGYMLGRPYRTEVDRSASWSSNPWVWAITFKRVEDIADKTFAEAAGTIREVRHSLGTGGVKLKGQGGR